MRNRPQVSGADEQRAALLGYGIALFISVYFLWFSWHGLSAHFAPDDMMNMFLYWNHGFGKVLIDQFDFRAYRPMGGLFYLPIFHFAGLNPFPYRVAILAILAFNVYLTYRFTKYLTGSDYVAALSAIVLSYHAELADVWYDTAVIYDILCFTFFFAALNVYMRRRARDQPLRWRDTILFLLLYVGALNSKEMAATLPLLLVAYECVFHPPEKVDLASLRAWLGPHGAATMSAVALTAGYALCKMFGKDAMAATGGYRMVFSIQRFMESSQMEVNALLYQYRVFMGWKLIVLWVILFAVAWISRDRALRFLFVFMMLSPQPVVFLEGRIWGCLYIPLMGWAVFGCILVWRCGTALSRWAPEPLVRTLLFAGAVAILAWKGVELRRVFLPRLQANQELTWDVIQELRQTGVKPRSGSRIVFERDPFKDWDMQFIASLYFDDRSCRIWLLNKTPLSDSEIAGMDYVLRFDGRKLQRATR